MSRRFPFLDQPFGRDGVEDKAHRVTAFWPESFSLPC